jgi:hypothetical protein
LALAAADVAKTLQLVNDVDAVENYYGFLGTAKVPSWMAYDLFAVFSPKKTLPVHWCLLPDFWAVSLRGIDRRVFLG